MVEDYATARQTGDAEAMAAMFTTRASVSILGREYQRSDGTLATYFEVADYPSIVLREPMLVDGHRVTYFDGSSGRSYPNVVEFTTSGDLKIVSHDG